MGSFFCAVGADDPDEEDIAEEAPGDTDGAQEHPQFHMRRAHIVMGDPDWAVIPMGEPATWPPYHGTPLHNYFLIATPVTM